MYTWTIKYTHAHTKCLSDSNIFFSLSPSPPPLLLCRSCSRCVTMLRAFKDVISDYTTPLDAALPRDLDKKLKPCVTIQETADEIHTGTGMLLYCVLCDSVCVWCVLCEACSYTYILIPFSFPLSSFLSSSLSPPPSTPPSSPPSSRCSHVLHIYIV